jgi:hypothetical protein
MTYRAKLVFSLVVVLAIVGIAWIALIRDRAQELEELKAMLPGAETLNDKDLIAEPSLTEVITSVELVLDRQWVYVIDADQQSRFLASCRLLESSFPNNDFN